jgi:septum formation protein
LPMDVDEQLRAGERPHDYVRRLAVEKSAAALRVLTVSDDSTNDRTPEILIIGADTAVVVDDEILGKPTDDADAERMLRRLSGRSHLVLTGVSVRSETRQLDAVEETRVFFGQLSDAEVGWYVQSAEGRDKAGGYAIQGLGSRFIPRIDGSYGNVVGLPIARLAELIKAFDGGFRVLASCS